MENTAMSIRSIIGAALSAATLACLALGPLPAAAHHAFAAEFDVSKPVSLRGVVTKVELINPHSWITMDVKDASGKTVSWMIEGGSPNSLFKKGVTKQTVPIGSELVIDGYQARDGGPRAVGRNIAFADGKPLFFSTTKPEGAPQEP
jgi:hypothetical protein